MKDGAYVVLVVEDEPGLVRTYRLWLETAASRRLTRRVCVLDACTIRRAEEIVEEQGNELDLVVLDGTVIGGSTGPLISWIHREHQNLPMIAATANKDVAPRMIAAGCKARLDKPWSGEQLLATVDRLLIHPTN